MLKISMLLNSNKLLIGLIALLLLSFITVISYTALADDNTSNPADDYWNRGYELYEEGKYLQAAEMFIRSAEEELVSANPGYRDLVGAYNWTAHCYFQLEQYQQAIRYFEKALRITISEGFEEITAINYYNLGYIYQQVEDYKEASSYFSNALELAARVGLDNDSITMMLDALKEAYAFWEYEDDYYQDLGKHLQRFEKKLQLYQDIDYREGELFYLNKIGFILRRMEKYQEAINSYKLALVIARGQGWSTEIAEIIDSIYETYEDWDYSGDGMDSFTSDQRIRQYKEELLISQEYQQTTATRYYLSNIAKIYEEIEDYQQALDYYRQNLILIQELYQESGSEDDFEKLSYDYLNLVRIYKLQGRFYKAIQTCTELINKKPEKAEEEFYYFHYWGEPYYQRGLCYAELEQYKKAEENLRMALNYLDLLSIQKQYSWYALLAGEIERAREVLLEIYEDNSWELSVIKNLGHAYFLSDEVEKAWGYYSEYLDSTYYKYIDINKGEAGEDDGLKKVLDKKILEDFDLFIVQGVKPQLAKKGRTWLENEFSNTYTYYLQAEEYFDKAYELKEEKEYLAAAKMYGKAISVEEKAVEPRLEELANYVNEAGFCYSEIARYEEALKLYKLALATIKKTKDENEREDMGVYYNNIASVYADMGQYGQALDYYFKSLEFAEKTGNDNATEYNNIALVYFELGQYDQGFTFLQQALDLFKKDNNKKFVAATLNNIGSFYQQLDQYSKGLDYFQQAQELYMELGIDDIMLYLNFGSHYGHMKEYERAVEYYQQALKIAEDEEMKDRMATCYNNLGYMYGELGKKEKKLKCYLEALKINQEIGSKPGIALNSSNISTVYIALEDYQQAEEYAMRAIKIVEEIRHKVPSDKLKRSYLQTQIVYYQQLTTVYIKTGQLDKAFNIMELSKAKVLAERLAGKEIDLSIPYLSNIQHDMKVDEGLLIYANSDWEKMVQLAVNSKNKKGMMVEKKEFISKVRASYGAEIDQMLALEERARELDPGYVPTFEKINKDDEFSNIIRYYRKCLGQGEELKLISRELYSLLLAPLEGEFKDKEELVIVPEGILNFIPFEILIDEDDHYLVEKYMISYIQSETVSQLIKKREYSREREGLLAFGGAVYQKNSYQEDVIENQKQLDYLKLQVARTTGENRSARKYYSRLGLADWNNLPGTLTEVRNIERLITGARVITGKEASEDRVKELSRQGELANFRVLHFATHGIVVPEVPELSAVVFSQLKEDKETELESEYEEMSLAANDGYLRMGEIIDLNIKADFVNLSACETGLGKIYAGEGVVGLTQAFLLAGANSLSVSLWGVNDQSTTRFMVELYRLVKEEGLSYNQAVCQVKLMFIRGNFGKEYQNPYYWAPFVFYGR